MRLNQEYMGEDPVTRTTTAEGTRSKIFVTQIGTPGIVPTYAGGSPVPGPRPAPAGVPPVQVTATVVPNAPPKVLSSESGWAPFETLYHELSLNAAPVYNFWTPDEESNDRDSRGNRDLSDVPRYVVLRWRPAPDLQDPHAFAKSLSNQPSKQRVPGGTVGVTIGGLQFAPPMLQPVNFDMAVRSLANGHMAPGVVETVVSVHTATIVPAVPTPPANLVHEDSYLAKPALAGIPYPEFNNVLWNSKSSVFNTMTRIVGQVVSVAASKDQQNYVNGQFTVARPASPGGLAAIRSANASSPSISLTSRTATVTRTYNKSRVNEIYDSLQPASSDADRRADNDESWDTHQVRVRFVDTDLRGAVSQNRVDAIRAPEHAESLVAIAPQLGNLMAYSQSGMQSRARQVDVPSFSAPAGLKPLEYVGYIIEKYALDGSSYVLVETINIAGRDVDEYVDARVRYGVAYRYRIRAVLRWSRPRGVGPLGTDPTVADPSISVIHSLTPDLVTFFGGEWGKTWAKVQVIDLVPPEPPDELQVLPISREKRIVVSFKLPYNPQRDINRMTLWRKLQDQDGRDLTAWEQMQEFDAVERQGTRHLYLTKFVHDPADATGTKFSTVTSEAEEDFVEFAPLNSQFVDTDVEYVQEHGFRYVYAALCHSRHGEISVLSDQLSVRLNADWRRTGEYRVDFLSCAGVEKDFGSGVFATYPERRIRSELIVKPKRTSRDHARLAVTGQQRHGFGLMSPASYVLRIESLDDGQRIEVPVEMEYNTLPTQVVDHGTNVMIPNTDW